MDVLASSESLQLVERLRKRRLGSRPVRGDGLDGFVSLNPGETQATGKSTSTPLADLRPEASLLCSDRCQ
ncbi:hypothetical protein NQZ68_000984, partial [Dissostichus eleginoides]